MEQQRIKLYLNGEFIGEGKIEEIPDEGIDEDQLLAAIAAAIVEERRLRRIYGNN